MKRNLLKQMANEWRPNVWMVIELAVAILVIWIVSTILWTINKPMLQPMGTATDNVYILTVNNIDSDSPDFEAPNDTGSYSNSDYLADLDVLLSRLRAEATVAFVARHSNALPYNYNYNGSVLNISDDTIPYNANFRFVDSDMPKILRYTSLSGMSLNEMSDALSKGEILVSNSKEYEKAGRKVMDLIGKKGFNFRDSANLFRVAGVIQSVKRTHYSDRMPPTVIMPLGVGVNVREIAVRVHDGEGKLFEETFPQKSELQRHGNVRLSRLTLLDDRRDAVNRSTERDNNMYAVVIFFIMVTVFLGLLGTFWFRVQQRVSEIAIRKVCGATSIQIFRRIISEGLILLLGGTIIASAIMWSFSGKLIELVGKDLGRVTRPEILVCELVTIAFMTLVVVLSLWWPALRVMKIEPALAIKDE